MISDQDKQAFKDAATKLAVWREAAELKAKQTGKMVCGDADVLAAGQAIQNLLFKFNQQHQIGGIRFRGAVYVLHKGNGPYTILPDRFVETIED
jgi:hypothetical protein